MIRIIIADDHTIIRDGLKKILKEESDINLVGEASGYFEVMQTLAKEEPDLLVLDISMPGRDGLEILKEVKSLYPKVKVLMLSMHPEDRYAVRAIKRGAKGYLSKESAAEELVNAIRKIAAGGRYISAELADKMVDYMETDLEKPAHELLSDREFQVLRKIAIGETIDQIAQEISLSPNTIATYRERILAKLQLKSNVEIANYALRNKLID
jgi:DNA-binding NarL/FixJ family response regulator